MKQRKNKGSLCKYREGEAHTQSFGVVVCEVRESCFPIRELAPRTLSRAQLGSLVLTFDELGDIGVGWIVVEDEVADDFDDVG